MTFGVDTSGMLMPNQGGMLGQAPVASQTQTPQLAQNPLAPNPMTTQQVPGVNAQPQAQIPGMLPGTTPVAPMPVNPIPPMSHGMAPGVPNPAALQATQHQQAHQAAQMGAYQTQMVGQQGNVLGQPGLAPPPQSLPPAGQPGMPQVGIPNPQAAMNPMQNPQMPMQGQAPQVAGQPPAPGAQAQLDWSAWQQQNVDQGLAGAVMQNLIDQGLQGQDLQNALNQALHEGVGDYGDAETYQAYTHRFDQLRNALGQQYGQQGDAMLQNAFEQIRAQGGDALLHKFAYDPDMLAPEIIMPYVTGHAAGGNPYEEYMSGGPQGAYPQPAGQPASYAGQAVNPLAGQAAGVQGIDQQLQALLNPTTPEAQAYLNGPQGQLHRLQLQVAKSTMMRGGGNPMY